MGASLTTFTGKRYEVIPRTAAAQSTSPSTRIVSQLQGGPG